MSEICSIVKGEPLCCTERLKERVEYGFASDLMSDVLTIKSVNFLLITGLTNIQLLRTAEMADAPYILLCRGKKATEEMLRLAEENNILILRTKFSLFRSAGLLYSNGLKALY
ncbi:MAG: hypothetical protein WC960_01995 [Bacteroidales bacterium]